MKLAKKELENANKKHPQFNSEHEGHAILREEVHEAMHEMMEIYSVTEEDMWLAIMNNEAPEMDILKVQAYAVSLASEAIQIVAMTMKFMHYLTTKKLKGKIESNNYKN